MVIEIREPDRQDKAQWLSLWQGYTRFYGSPQPAEVTEHTWQRMLDAASPMLGRVRGGGWQCGGLCDLYPPRRNMG